MTYWYADLENVQYAVEHIIPFVRRGDHVVLAYSDTAYQIHIKFVEALKRKRVVLEGLECVTGTPNAMDFQICARLGMDIAKGKGTRWVIWSRDTGYDAVCLYFQKLGADVSRVSPPEGPTEVCHWNLMENKEAAQKSENKAAATKCENKPASVGVDKEKELAKLLKIASSSAGLRMATIEDILQMAIMSDDSYNTLNQQLQRMIGNSKALSPTYRVMKRALKIKKWGL